MEAPNKIKSTSSTWAQKAPSDKQALNAFIFGTYFTISSDRTPSKMCIGDLDCLLRGIGWTGIEVSQIHIMLAAAKNFPLEE